MRLFQHSSGIVIAFGFDMEERRRDPHKIAWSDLDGQTWSPSVIGTAGWSVLSDIEINPEFVFEMPGNRVVAYQPGLAVEMTFVGTPLVWSFVRLLPDHQQQPSVDRKSVV